jgi:hypothetical protein
MCDIFERETRREKHALSVAKNENARIVRTFGYATIIAKEKGFIGLRIDDEWRARAIHNYSKTKHRSISKYAAINSFNVVFWTDTNFVSDCFSALTRRLSDSDVSSVCNYVQLLS